MASRSWVLAGMLATMPAMAEDVVFEGHTLEVDASREARPILGMRGTRYSIPGSVQQIVGKAEQCAARQTGALTVESTDADGGGVGSRRVPPEGPAQRACADDARGG